MMQMVILVKINYTKHNRYGSVERKFLACYVRFEVFTAVRMMLFF
jgi:hypothetical protein